MLRRHALGLAAAGPVLLGKTLTRLGLKRPPEAWRSLLGSALRGEPSRSRLLGAYLRASPHQLAATFSQVGLSVIREAKVFVAPLSDVGYPGGFLAVGGVGCRRRAGQSAP